MCDGGRCDAKHRKAVRSYCDRESGGVGGDTASAGIAAGPLYDLYPDGVSDGRGRGRDSKAPSDGQPGE